MKAIDDSQKLTFSVTLKQIEVELVQADNSIVAAALKEMTGQLRSKYDSTEVIPRVKIESGKPNGMTSYEGIAVGLLSYCLWKGDKLFTKEEIESLPSKVVEKLFIHARKLNGLDAKAGNESSGEGQKKSSDGSELPPISS